MCITWKEGIAHQTFMMIAKAEASVKYEFPSTSLLADSLTGRNYGGNKASKREE